MELTIQQINYLLLEAFKSPLTAEQIVRLIKDQKSGSVVREEPLPGLREFFSKSSIARFTDNKPLITRLSHVVREGRQFERFIYLSLDEAIEHPQFPPLKRWKNCGKVASEVVRRMFQSHGIDIDSV